MQMIKYHKSYCKKSVVSQCDFFFFLFVYFIYPVNLAEVLPRLAPPSLPEKAAQQPIESFQAGLSGGWLMTPVVIFIPV